MVKCFRPLCMVAATLASLCFAPMVAANGGHFMVDDAAIAPPRTCQLETWVTRQSPETTMTLNPACNITGGSEWSIPIEYDTVNSETRAMGLEYKTVLFHPNRGPAIAVSGGAMYQRAESAVRDVYLNVPVSWQIIDPLTLHLNGGVMHDRALDDTYATWGLAGTLKTISGPVLIAEYTDNDRYDPTYGLGARFTIGSTRWTLDMGVARDTHLEETAYTLGINIPRLF